jgi:hypothetical protein
MALTPRGPGPSAAMLLADAVEVREIARAAREHLAMDVAFIGEFREGVWNRTHAFYARLARGHDRSGVPAGASRRRRLARGASGAA